MNLNLKELRKCEKDKIKITILQLQLQCLNQNFVLGELRSKGHTNSCKILSHSYYSIHTEQIVFFSVFL